MALQGADAGVRSRGQSLLRALAAAALVVALAAVGVWPARAEALPADASPPANSSPPVSASPPAAQASPNPPVPAVPAPASAAPAPPPGPASSAAANPYAGLPKGVARVVRELEAECRAEGKPNWKPGTIYEVVNVSPDGRPDYLIDTHAIACDGGFTPWIGSDGFRHILLVSTGPGRWVRAFDRGARGFEIETRGRKVPQVIVFSHSAYCTRPNPERYMRCTQVYEWRRGKLRKISEDWFTD